ncbi:MAG: glycogen-binding domain-containing protein [Candidatus Omnitrophica bacterium]|nr:glycogen-binding domain-containing protein [Candidatus Omnitrophota bacterium]MCM8799775.1 glycogen-binding domain-containing protein [Candidatus Omnitrophota bacterium]
MVRKCTTKKKSITFKLFAPYAKKVAVAGSFNKWDTNSLLAKKDSQGNWTAKLSLKPGRYEYKFFVDGVWMEDPNCSWRIPNPLGTQNCVIEVK